MKKTFGIVTALLFAALTVLVPTPTAQAAPIPANTVNVAVPTATVTPAEDYSDKIVDPDSDTGQLLPINRWATSMGGFHSRRNFSVTQPFESAQLFIGGLLMGAGNNLWTLSSALVSTAATSNMTVAGSAELDRIAAAVGEGIVGSAGGASIAVVFVVFVLGASFWTARREGLMPVVRQVGSRLLVIALIGIFVTGSYQSTREGKSYKPGKLSPAWVTGQIDDAIGTVASAVTEAPLRAVIKQREEQSSGDVLGCPKVISAMQKEYLSKTGNAGQVGAAMPLAMSMIWESVGPKAWSMVQFGASPQVRPYSEKAWCHVAEMLSDNPKSEHVALVNRSGAKGAIEDAMAFDDSNSTKLDIAAVGWAACTMKANSTFETGTVTTASGNKQNAAYFSNTCGGLLGNCDLPKACEEWWSKPPLATQAKDAVKNIPVIGWVAGFLDPTKDSKFDWWDDNGAISRDVKDPGAAEYIINLHGAGNPGVPVAAGLTYLLSALCVFITFALLALAIIASKLILFIMGIAIFFLLAATLIPTVNTGEKLKQLAKAWLSFSMISAIALTLMAMLLIITQAIIRVGETMLAGTGIFMILWVGMSPMLAIIAVNFLFKKVFKMPNMFTPKGALAWAGSAAGIGGAALAGSSMAQRAVSRGLHSLETRAQTKALGRAVSGTTGATGHSGGVDSLTVGSKATVKPTVSGDSPKFNIDGAKGTGVLGLDGVKIGGSGKVESIEAGKATAANGMVESLSSKTGSAGLLQAGRANADTVMAAQQLGVFERAKSGISGIVEEQRMLAEMRPDSNMGVFMHDMAAVKEKATQGRQMLSAARNGDVRGVLGTVPAVPQPSSVGHKFVVAAKTTGKAALTGADRFARLPSVAVSGVKTVGKVGVGVAGAGAKAAVATVAGSLVPGVGMFVGPAMGVASLQKSLARVPAGVRERSARIRGDHESWLAEHGMSVVGVPEERKIDGGAAPAVGASGVVEEGKDNASRSSSISEAKKETSENTLGAKPVAETEPALDTPKRRPRKLNSAEEPSKDTAPIQAKEGRISHDSSTAAQVAYGILGDVADAHGEKQQLGNAQVQAHLEQMAVKNSGTNGPDPSRARTLTEAMTGVSPEQVEASNRIAQQQSAIDNAQTLKAEQAREQEAGAQAARRTAEASMQAQKTAQEAETRKAQQEAQETLRRQQELERQVQQAQQALNQQQQQDTAIADKPPVFILPNQNPQPNPVQANTTATPATGFLSRRGRHKEDGTPTKGATRKTMKPQA